MEDGYGNMYSSMGNNRMPMGQGQDDDCKFTINNLTHSALCLTVVFVSSRIAGPLCGPAEQSV
jgi:hypothetical protein